MSKKSIAVPSAVPSLTRFQRDVVCDIEEQCKLGAVKRAKADVAIELVRTNEDGTYADESGMRVTEAADLAISSATIISTSRKKPAKPTKVGGK